MCLRYSSSVVAPTQRSSPRESSGFSRLAASTAPSAAPAPTIVCSSSMNRMMRPSEFLISASTAFNRSSNSPRYLAPASSEPMSSDHTRRSFSPSGTSRATMRCASPSAIAVLPTPGSPIRTGLFFVRRLRIWITRRISSSRPITGSSLPSSAASVRSTPELVQRLVRAFRILRRDALAAAYLLDPRLDLAARDRLEGEEEMLGRDVLVLHLGALGVGAVEHTRERRRRIRLLLAALHGRQRRDLALRFRREGPASRRRAPGRAARAAGGRVSPRDCRGGAPRRTRRQPLPGS